MNLLFGFFKQTYGRVTVTRVTRDHGTCQGPETSQKPIRDLTGKKLYFAINFLLLISILFYSKNMRLQKKQRTFIVTQAYSPSKYE